MHGKALIAMLESKTDKISFLFLLEVRTLACVIYRIFNIQLKQLYTLHTASGAEQHREKIIRICEFSMENKCILLMDFTGDNFCHI